MKDRIILDLCGGSGSWSKPYTEAGYQVLLIDLAAGQDIRLQCPPSLAQQVVHGILAAPPCTEFARSGARWWKVKGEQPLLDTLAVADACMRFITLTNPVWWALENPAGRLRRYYGPPRLITQPYHYGDPYSKITCLWGNFNLPIKNTVEPVRACKAGSWLMQLSGQGKHTKALRSMTPSGFARAFFEANP